MSLQSQAHLAYLALERLIVTLKLEPGALVTEKRLIELAGLGRTPVCEAIQKLAWQGLMDVRPRVGLQITTIRPDDQVHVMQARQKLENDGFTVQISPRAIPATAPRGTVAYTSPSAGTPADQNTAVMLFVSNGMSGLTRHPKKQGKGPAWPFN